METTVHTRCDTCGPVALPGSAILISTLPGYAWHSFRCPQCNTWQAVEITAEGVRLLRTGDVRCIAVHYPLELEEAHVGPAITEEEAAAEGHLINLFSYLAAMAAGEQL